MQEDPEGQHTGIVAYEKSQLSKIWEILYVDPALLHDNKPEKVKPTKAENNCYIALSGSPRSSLASLASLVSLVDLAPAGGEENKQTFLCIG